jgi:O-antigen ligase
MNTWLCAAVLSASFLFGGGSRIGFLGDTVVQLVAVPLLLLSWGLWVRDRESLILLRQSSGGLLLAAATLFLAVILVQLFPLPVSWFSSRIPSSATEATLPANYLQPSFTPTATWAVALSSIVPFALFAGVSQLNVAERFKLVWLITSLGTLGLLIGFLQVIGGAQSYLRFFEFTNPSEAVGFFANRNHFAAQLYTLLIFASLWFALTANGLIKPGVLNSRAILWFAAAAALIIAIVAGLAMARSRAGILLSMAAIIGIAAMFATSGQTALNSHATRDQRILILVLGLALLFAMQFGLHRVLTRFEADPLDDLRTALTPATFKLAAKNMPFGTGLGSFVPVYANSENTGDLFTGFANRAHNDWAEFLLETGALGIGIIVLFLWWFALRIAVVWRRKSVVEIDRHAILQRGATLVIALLLTHSLVDYPLRTTSMAALFAFACAILVRPPEDEKQPVPDEQKARSKRRHSKKRASTQPMQAASSSNENEWSAAWKDGVVRNASKSG